MSPFSAPVLVGAALVTSPAWWNAVQGTGSLAVALTRFLVSVALCWIALEVVAAFVGPSPAPAPAEDSAGETVEDPAPA